MNANMSGKITLGQKVSRLGLRLVGGWEMTNTPPPDTEKCVIIAAPHTTNKDGLLLVLLTRAIGLQASWLVKNFWTKAPFGWVTKRVGAVGVDRGTPKGMVGQMAETFAERDEFALMVPPEGTRSLAEHWRSGFYRIALEAGVPLVPSFLDYESRTGGFGEAIHLTGDVAADMDKIRSFYGDKAHFAKFPEKYGPVRLREED